MGRAVNQWVCPVVLSGLNPGTFSSLQIVPFKVEMKIGSVLDMSSY
jgi:hypothetical protein